MKPTHELPEPMHVDIGLISGERFVADLEAGPLKVTGEPLEHLVTAGFAVPIGGRPEVDAVAQTAEVDATPATMTEGGSDATEQ